MFPSDWKWISAESFSFSLQLSWADLFYTAASEMFSGLLETDVNKDYPELRKLVEKVRSLPNIKAYIETRPKTVF